MEKAQLPTIMQIYDFLEISRATYYCQMKKTERS
jgi:hypothetical protein